MKKNKEIEIKLLVDCLQHIPVLAELWYQQISRHWAPNASIERAKQNLIKHANYEQLPMTFVAFDNNQPVGMASLRALEDGKKLLLLLKNTKTFSPMTKQSLVHLIPYLLKRLCIRLKSLVHAGCLGAAAITNPIVDVSNKRVGVIFSGGNMDLKNLA